MVQRRKHYRLPYVCPCVLIYEGKKYPTHLVDISLKGAMVGVPVGLEPKEGHAYRLEVTLDEAPGAIIMEVVPAHWSKGRIGLRCFSMDVDSLTHLRRLLELNLGDPTLVEKELRQMD